jgi:hypothetical protein
MAQCPPYQTCYWDPASSCSGSEDCPGVCITIPSELEWTEPNPQKCGQPGLAACPPDQDCWWDWGLECGPAECPGICVTRNIHCNWYESDQCPYGQACDPDYPCPLDGRESCSGLCQYEPQRCDLSKPDPIHVCPPDKECILDQTQWCEPGYYCWGVCWAKSRPKPRPCGYTDTAGISHVCPGAQECWTDPQASCDKSDPASCGGICLTTPEPRPCGLRYMDPCPGDEYCWYDPDSMCQIWTECAGICIPSE